MTSTKNKEYYRTTDKETLDKQERKRKDMEIK